MRPRRRAGRFVVLLVTLGLLLAGCGGDRGPQGNHTGASLDDATLHGTPLDPPFEVPALPLTDTDGAPYSLTEDTGADLTLVFFGYVNCPDICQAVMASLASAMTRLDEADRERIQVVYVTTDPARDTPAVLADYLGRFDDSFIGLTGELDRIIEVAKPLGVGITQGEKLPSGGYDVSHGATITGIDGDDHGTIYWGEETSSAQFAEDLTTLLEEEAA